MANYDILLATPAAAVATNGTVTFNYPSGRNVADYIRGTEQLSVPGRQAIYPLGASNFSVTYGPTSLTVTWLNALTIPALTLLRFAAQVYDSAALVTPYSTLLPAPQTHPGYLPSRTYPLMPATYSQASAVPAIDTLYLHPFQIHYPVVLTAGAIRVVTGGAASSVKAAIYANSGPSMRPAGPPLMSDNTGPATTSNNATVSLALAGALDPGWYWFATKFTGTLPTCYGIPGQNNLQTYLMGLKAGESVTTTALSFADAFSNALPTLAEGAAFTNVAVTGVPVGFMVT